MFIKKQSLENGTVRTLVGDYDNGGHENYISVDPPTLGELSRIVARVEISSDNNRAGLETTKAVLEQMLHDVEERIATEHFGP